MIKTLISSLGKIVPEEELQAKVLWRSIGVMNWSAQAMYTAGFLLFWLFGFSTTLGSVILLALPLSKRQRSLPE